MQKPLVILDFDSDSDFIVELFDDFDVTVFSDLTPKSITVTMGFKSDLASIPKIVWGLLSPLDKGMLYTAILHDYLYSKEGISKYGLSRKEVDKLFLAHMLQRGLPSCKAYAAYWAVRLKGAEHYG